MLQGAINGINVEETLNRGSPPPKAPLTCFFFAWRQNPDAALARNKKAQRPQERATALEPLNP